MKFERACVLDDSGAIDARPLPLRLRPLDLAPGPEYFVPAGAFESRDFELASQIYIDCKPAYYDFANRRPC